MTPYINKNASFAVKQDDNARFMLAQKWIVYFKKIKWIKEMSWSKIFLFMNVLSQLQKKFEIYIWWNSELHGLTFVQSVGSWWNELFPLYTVSTLYQYQPLSPDKPTNKVLTLHYDAGHLDRLIREMLCKRPIHGDIHALHFQSSAYKP